MSIEHIKNLLRDLDQIINDASHKNIFALLADFKDLSDQLKGILPELKEMKKEDVPQILEESYKLLKSIISLITK